MPTIKLIVLKCWKFIFGSQFKIVIDQKSVNCDKF